ncbi:hypothetical protein ALI22I_14380 [Saccharothrix sp. ALI-22-I]|uniref:hypothetical protein n=1 Tax=Saccharothrix sp. ALI-22-I TaxID=1933778 RepID=UPI00097C28E4|nr:hypothetical protein [Saccharothrix sp. ALI-22-I]ONI89685.1 hypothetical protein ALI22I_14380 [Saccharothrix sp. ALI-22-I]
MERLFDPLRDEDPLPPSEVDIDRAIVAGRRQVRARWVGTAAVVAAVAFLVPVLGLPGGGGSSVGPATQPGSAVGIEDFDPMRRVVTVADVPGATPESYTTARRWQRIMLKIGETGFGLATVYAPGRQATDGQGVIRPETGTPAEPIGGRPAYWVGRENGELLAWQWTDGAWALLTVEYAGAGGDAGTDSEADRDTMRRIAQAVRVGVGEPVTMPFTLPLPTPPLPTPHRLIGATTQIRPPDNPFVRTGLVFATEDPSDPDREVGAVSVAVENGSKMAQHLGANQTVDGHPAKVDGESVIIFGFTDEFAIDVRGPSDALLTIARTVRMVPTPSDKSTWTSQPLT